MLHNSSYRRQRALFLQKHHMKAGQCFHSLLYSLKAIELLSCQWQDLQCNMALTQGGKWVLMAQVYLYIIYHHTTTGSKERNCWLCWWGNPSHRAIVFWQGDALVAGRTHWLLLVATAIGKNCIPKVQLGWMDWIDLGTISLPFDGLNHGWDLNHLWLAFESMLWLWGWKISY